MRDAWDAVLEFEESLSLPKFWVVDIMDCNTNKACGLGECYESLGKFVKVIQVYKPY